MNIAQKENVSFESLIGWVWGFRVEGSWRGPGWCPKEPLALNLQQLKGLLFSWLPRPLVQLQVVCFQGSRGAVPPSPKLKTGPPEFHHDLTRPGQSCASEACPAAKLTTSAACARAASTGAGRGQDNHKTGLTEDLCQHAGIERRGSRKRCKHCASQT